MEFADEIRTREQLRAVLPAPAPRALAKAMRTLDAHCRAIIERAPFVVVASANARGELDVSPRGDPAGFVLVLDERTLAIPDRPGNRRADTMCNLLERPALALLFVVPGRAETLRVNGSARIVRDAWLRERMAVAGQAPALAMVVTVEEAFVHCGKSSLRSRLWQPSTWPALDTLPSHARCLADQAGVDAPLEQIEEEVRQGYRDRLY